MSLERSGRPARFYGTETPAPVVVSPFQAVVTRPYQGSPESGYENEIRLLSYGVATSYRNWELTGINPNGRISAFGWWERHFSLRHTVAGLYTKVGKNLKVYYMIGNYILLQFWSGELISDVRKCRKYQFMHLKCR